MSGADLIAAHGLDRIGLKGRLSADQPLSSVTWFRVGGPAELLFQPADVEDLALFLRHLPEAVPVLPIGLGSNLLFHSWWRIAFERSAHTRPRVAHAGA